MPMLSLRRIPGKSYFITAFVVCSLLFSAFSTVLYRHYSEARATNQRVMYYYETLRLVRVTLVDLLNMETGVRGYILTGKESFLEPYNDAKPQVQNDLMHLTALKGGNYFNLGSFFDEVKAFQELLEKQISFMRSGGQNAIPAEILNNQKIAMDHLRNYVDDLTENRISELRIQVSASEEKGKNFVSLLIIGTVLGIGAMLLGTMIIMSLTARSHKAEEESRKTEERFRMVMNGVNDGLYDYDVPEGKAYYSPAYKSMLGYSDNEHPDSPGMFRRLLHPEDSEQVFKTYNLYRDRESAVYANIFRLRHKNGSWRWILSRGVGIWDKSGRLQRLIGTHTDITEQKKREEDLQQLNSDLETFTYIVSHDLRSPLVNLRGFASEMELSLKQANQIIKKIKPELPAKEKAVLTSVFVRDIPEALQFIKQAVGKMDALTAAVLDLSRLGKREFKSEAIDAHALLHRCLSSLAYEITQKEVEITCDETLPEAVSDPLAIEQIFGNLIDNAVKYLAPDRKGKIDISAKHTGSYIMFTVRDNGRGIAEEDRKKVFEIFRRARNTGDARGIGMGLTYVKATLRKLGGTVWFDSKLGEGSAFHFTIPAQSVAQQPARKKIA